MLLILKKFYSKKADSMLNILILDNKHLFIKSELTNEYRFTDSEIWIKNFNKQPAKDEKTIEKFDLEDIDYLITKGKGNLLGKKMLPIKDSKYIEIFEKLIKL
tara:strand:- start:50 stop:358 length:309 start_codon:yes stop_codon:yes gene_type:complete